ncbi:MAG: argininosuccinate lyase, partial [Burkholderiales bacterium]
VKNLKLPFRQCHHITGRIVRIAEAKNCQLNELSLEDMQSVEPNITKEIFTVIGVENSVNSRNSYGGTAPSQVKQQLEIWKTKLKLAEI